MASISLKNFKKQFADDVKLWAAQCTVRECDEESKGQFVAFVDQADQSFDVSVNINSKQEITAIACDCSKGDGLCQHKFALLLHLSGNEKVTTPKLVKNKISAFDRVFENISHNDLKNWLLQVFEKDKALKEEFLQVFTEYEVKILTKVEIEKKLKELQKAVIGTRKNIETSEFKKLMMLWENFAIAAIKPYLENPTLLIHFEIFYYISETLHNQIRPISTKTFTPFHNIQKKMNDLASQAISALLDNDAFEKSVNVFIHHLMTGGISYNTVILSLSYDTFVQVDEIRKNVILDLVVPKYISFHTSNKYGDAEFTKTVLKMVCESNNFGKYYDAILPISYANNFNVDLIELLIGIQKYEKAIKICNSIISSNYYPEYNLPYWILLKKLYIATNNVAGALKIKGELLPITGNFEDFVEIYESMPDSPERKAWRAQLLSKHRNKAKNGEFPNSDQFCIKMAAYDKNYARLIDYLREYNLVQNFVPFLDDMLDFNKNKTLTYLLKFFNDLTRRTSDEYIQKEKSQYPIILDLLLKHFHEHELNQYFMQHSQESLRPSNGSLAHFLSKHLL